MLRHLALAALGMVLALSSIQTRPRAEPPPGTDLNSPEHAWWDCHKMPRGGASCCGTADGHTLSDSEWRLAPAAKGYQVLIGGQWADVPKDSVLHDADKCGPDPKDDGRSLAKVWWSLSITDDNDQPRILCFIPGQMY